ncbi:VPLPA-CTERM protein sorting domain-containing protein [Cognatiyoonia koreensis]|uniref:VPLPA-CTERM protein sorting domain-containing protein n=1 Tax=Cognatiyoonia koreensis TaxID=364200 RepID=A0A1I0P9H1_9RHOB|nr:VPLPA-CTERM sorting domain-containing protein [Cognatiyoonia koreensis]SEW10872.1 VPLPA-CTERM protein sorting domain-containing protein [Cognatiyoonia koreensis]
MNFFKLSSIAFAAAFLSAGAVSAATITASNGGTVIASPLNVGEDNPTNSSIQAFNEGVDVLLLADLGVDGGTPISAGTRVDSHMIFLNTRGRTDVTDTATFTFSEMILGIMSSQAGTNLFASDGIVNGPVTYTGGNYGDNRGLEGSDTADFINVVGGMFSVNVGMHVTEPGDWVRVITASSVSPVPVPAGMLLLPTGLIALGAMRRRKKRKTA